MADNIISSLGAGSGIDIKNLVTQLTSVERAPQELRLDTRKEKLEAQISGYGQLRSAFDTFKGSLTPLSNGDLFNARSATVPNSDVITANSVEPGAQTGSYSIEVQEVAQAQTLAIGGAAQTDPKAALNAAGSMTIRFGAWTDADGNAQPFAANDDRTALTLDVADTDSLQDIANKINAADSGVQAAMIKVDDQYQLTLTADSGRNNAMEISTSGTNLEAFSFKDGALNANQTQAAQDAQLKINGLAVTRESNEIDDLIEGFSFTVNKKGTAGESLNFSITADKTAADQAIRDFVEAYNSFQKTTQELVGYTRDEDDNLVRGGLAGDSTARTMINRMREQIGGVLPGARAASRP
jgi:flagellar hook-associated protein 2